ncbi:MAG: DNA mismatch repair endonuclease MutL [Anaerovoracaceae bacterium]
MLQNNEINLLPAEVSEKIAAGEVIDRPLSIVKELVENSVDAGADNIVVEIKNGGKTHLRVTDNGGGIPAKDVSKAFQRHATSKIRSAADLDMIHTLGFRGEALTSIAAVSKVEIITKTALEKAGVRMILEGGQILDNGPVGCPDGTTIIVTDLFYNTPARLKFMKTDGAEGSLIIDFISKMALAYPDIRFRMINNGTVLFSTRGKGSIYSNILTIYSKQIGDRLIEIDEAEGDYRLQAYISPPDINRPNRRGQVYFVNGRSVSNKILEAAVTSAYQERIAQGRSPLVYLFLQVPSHRVDVNIHPNKREVRFDDNDMVSQFVVNALLKGLQSKSGLAALQMKDPFRIKSQSEADKEVKDEETMREIQVDIKSILSTIRQEKKILKEEDQNNEGFAVEEKKTDYSTKVEEIYVEDHSNTLSLEALRPIGSIFATYILAVDEEHFYLIDQHAAHERVFYEKLLSQFEREDKNTQLLLTPTILETSPAIANSTELWMDRLLQIGFAIEPFGVKAFRIKGIPSFMELNQATNFLEGFVGEMENAGSVMDEKKLGRIITSACKSAVKANDALTMEEIRRLLKDLAEAKNPLSCPHGRPTLLMLSVQDIERLFKRA